MYVQVLPLMYKGLKLLAWHECSEYKEIEKRCMPVYNAESNPCRAKLHEIPAGRDYFKARF